ncbi:ABC transporter substrate-binding protein [Pseudoduganella sp. OTU4001]|uniref:ABC transporter substrate-binding protein n=1 Tax=Pseudoduganella sp. OTU4001 TaxID=3043854 RepID=UPI00313CD9B7
MEKWSRMRVAALGAALALALASCGGGTSVDSNPAASTAPGTLKLGLLTTRTGSAANQGQFVEYAARLAVQEINAAGGVNGQQVELILRDDKLDADTGVASARELLALEVPAIFGPFSSRVAVPVAQQATIPAGVPFVVSGSSPQITTLADNGTVWRTVASDALQGAAVADHMLSQGNTRVAILHVDDLFGMGASEAVRARLTARGYPPLTRVQYPVNKTVGFDAELTALLANGVPDAVFIVGFALDGASIARGLKERLGARMPRLYGAGNFGTAFISNAGEAGVGMQAVAPTAPRDSPDYVAYRTAFVKAAGIEPEGTSFTGYDAVYLIALAMAQGGANTRAAVLANIGSVSRAEGAGALQVHPGQFAQALSAIKAGRDIDYQGVGSVIDFDAAGDPTAGTYLILEAVKAADGSVGFVERKVISFP